LKESNVEIYSLNDVIRIMGTNHQSDGLHIYTDTEILQWRKFQKPYRPDYYTIVIMAAGKVTYQLNMSCFSAQTNSVIIISPATVVQVVEMDEDVEMFALSFTTGFFRNSAMDKNNFNAIAFFASKEIVNFQIEASEREDIISLIKQLKKLNSDTTISLFRAEIIQYTFNSMIYRIAAQFKIATQHKSLQIKRKEEMALRFFNLLKENFNAQRKVSYYANALFITPGHLTKTLKEVSGKTARELIDDAILFEARVLLSNSKLSISQIAIILGFSEQSILGKFFKKLTGLSPTDYRKSNNNLLFN